MSPNERLKKIRKALGLSQAELAGGLGIKQGSYSDIERGKASISKQIELLLKQQYRVNIDYLYKGKGELFTKSEEPQEKYNAESEIVKVKEEQIEELMILLHLKDERIKELEKKLSNLPNIKTKK